MRRGLKVLSLIILSLMLLTSLPIVASANDSVTDENVITIGDGGNYKTIQDAITAVTADGLDGKTLKLISDVTVGSTKFESKSATAPTIVVDGDGWLASMTSGFVCIGVNITFKNIHATQKSVNHPFVYARGKAHVTVENCVTNDTFKYVFALNNAGDCHITVNSGDYTATQKIFNLDAYNNISASANTVTVKGGFFKAAGGNVATVSSNTKFTIEGGLFYSETKAPMIVDTKNILSASTNKASVTVSNASFIYPTDGMGLFAEDASNKAAVNMTADASVKLFAVIDGSTDGTSYKGGFVSADSSFPTFDGACAVSSSATAINGIDNAFAKAHLAGGKTFLVNSAETLKLLDNSMFDGARILFNADTTANVDFAVAKVLVDKNGYHVPNVKSTNLTANIRSNLDGAKVYWQVTGKDAPVGTAVCKARIVIGINGENYKKAGLLYTSDPTRANAANLTFEENSEYGESVKIYKADGYYTSVLAGGETVEASELDGLGLLVLNAGEYNSKEIKTPIYVRAYLVDAGGNTTYTEIKKIDIESAYAGEGELVDTYTLDQGHTMELYKRVSKASYDAKCTELIAQGYLLKQENTAGGNAYRTYYKANGTEMRYIYWTDYNKQMRVISATTDKLPIISIDGNNDLCTAKLITLQGGDELAMVIRINDGRFIIIDGGNDGQQNGKEIYNILKANAPDPDNIVIAAWYITHAHSDHQGGFLDFARTYYNDSTIKLECMMHNQLNNGSYIKEGTTSNEALRYMANYYPDVPVYMPLTGQKYTFSKTTIEILYTMSDYLPNVIVKEPDGKADGNTQTMPCMIDIVNDADYDDKLFVMGDMVEYACNDVCNRYGNLIKCDIVQVSHHGLCIAPYATPGYRRRNSTKEIYSLIDPTIAFWPGKEDQFANRMTGPVNIHLTEIIGGQDKYYKAWVQQHTFEFKAST